MQRWKRLLLLLAVPLLLLGGAEWFREARGPYWLGQNVDPEYAYLLNALALATGGSPGHFDHPGTPVQALGALVLRATHPGASRARLVQQVIADPERALGAIHAALLGLHAAVMFACGAWIWTWSQSPALALLFQLGSFSSVIGVTSAARVTPEALLWPLTLTFSALVLAWVRGGPPDRLSWLNRSFGAVCGLAVATKVTAAPLALVPMILLRSVKARFDVLLFAVVGFLLGTLPILALYADFARWLVRLATHTGHYGGGASGFVDLGTYLAALAGLARAEPLLPALALAGLGAGLHRWIGATPAARDSEPVRAAQALTAVCAMQLAQLALVAKHPGEHYLLPALGLLGLNAVLSARMLAAPPATARRWAAPALVAVALWQGCALSGARAKLTADRDQQLATVAQLASRFAGAEVIPNSGASSREYALYFGNVFAGLQFAGALHLAFPDRVFYNPWARCFLSFSVPVTPAELAAGKRMLILQGKPIEGPAAGPPGFSLERLNTGKPEAIYRMIADPSLAPTR